MITKVLILTYYKQSVKIIIKTNFSIYISNNILFYINNNNLLYFIVFFSKNLSSIKYNYKIYNKQLLAFTRCYEL